MRAEPSLFTTDYVASQNGLLRGAWRRSVADRSRLVVGTGAEATVVDGLISAGVSPLLLGVVPTPALAWMSAQMEAPAVMIGIAQWHDNGVKIFAQGGLKLTDEVEVDEALLHRERASDHRHRHRNRHVNEGTSPRRNDGSLKGLRSCLTAQTAQLRRGSRLCALGADTVYHDSPNGRNINDDCGATNTASLGSGRRPRCRPWASFDGDGDRVIAVVIVEVVGRPNVNARCPAAARRGSLHRRWS